MTVTSLEEQGLNIFIARQPIFDEQKIVYAYELLYRSDAVNRAHIADDGFATLKVIANSLLMGIQKLTSGKRAFIHFNRKLLLGKTPLLFPREFLGVEIMDPGEVEQRLMMACQQFKKANYTIILDSVCFADEYKPLLELADIIKLDFRATTPEQRQFMVKQLAATGFNVKLMAEKVETYGFFEEAQKLGCVYFQGFFFQKPDLISRKEMPGYKLNYLQILKKINEPTPDFNEIEDIIKRDVSLAYKLLRFINSASYGFKVSIRSIHHALILLGKREVKKWLTIIVMSGIGRSKPLELMNAVIVRARFCESLAEYFKLHAEPADFFLFGLFSMVEAFLDRPIKEILEELPLGEEIKQALLGNESIFNSVLKLVESFERADWQSFDLWAEKLKLNQERIAILYVDAVEWATVHSTED